MRKMLIWCCFLLVVSVLVGCNENSPILTNSIIGSNETIVLEDNTFVVNNFDNASMSILEDSVTPTGLTLEFTYNGEHQGLYGSPYTLLVYNEGQWSLLPNIRPEDESIFWTAIGYPVENGIASRFEIDWLWLYGELPVGHYCVLKNLSEFRGTGDFTEYHFAQEFTME